MRPIVRLGYVAAAWSMAGLLFAGVPDADAGELQDVRMLDGSVVRAEVLSLKDGIYTLRSPSFGTLQVPQRNVAGIGGAGAGSGSAAGAGAAEGIERMRRSLESDPKAMQQIMSLQNDAAVQRILNDPALMRAVRRGDMDALANDPAIKALMGNPTVKGLTRNRQ